MLNIYDYHKNPESLDQTHAEYFSKRKAFIQSIYYHIKEIEDEANINCEFDGTVIYVYADNNNTRYKPGEMYITFSPTANFLPIIELDDQNNKKYTYRSINDLTDEILGRYASYDDDD